MTKNQRMRSFLLFVISITSVMIFSTSFHVPVAMSSDDLGRLVDTTAPTGPPDGSRDDTFCGIAPGALEAEYSIWNDRPLFMWRGLADKVKVTTLGGQPIWDYSVPTGRTEAIYSGDALQAEELYQWWIDNDQNNAILFKLLPTEERSIITADIQALRNRLQSSGSSAEAIAIAEAQYFADKHLRSDALQSIYSIQSPSTSLTQAKQKIMANLVAKICPSYSEPRQGS
jgi:hypothetical protein